MPITSSASQKKPTEKRNKQAQLGLLAGLVLVEDTLEQKHERKSRDAIESGKVIGDQTAKALNDNIIGTNQFEPFPEEWWASP